MEIKTTNVATHLSVRALSEPDRVAVYMPRRSRGKLNYATLTFRELDTLSSQVARGLHEIGITRGVRTVLMVRPSLDFFTLTFALFKVGAVPVLIDPGMGIRNLGHCLAEATPQAFIGIPKAHIARRILGWGGETIRITVTTGSRLFGGQHTLASLQRFGSLAVAETQPDETAAILFTSGSTGIAKGVVYTHGIFAAQVEFLKAIYGIEPGEVDLCTFPLFALFAPALGMTAVIPEMDPTRPARVDPTKIIGAIEQFQVTNMFGSPALIDRVGRYGQNRGIKLPTLKRAISAGAPVSANIIERFTSMLSPGVQLFTPYGATESLPVANIGSDTILKETRQLTDTGAGVCVGHPVPGMDVRIIPIRDEPIPFFDPATCLKPREVGEIAVCGPVATREYFGRPEATAIAKMRDAEGRVWHRMGDVGYFDEQGRLWFCGRKAHRVETEQRTLFTIQCEAVFNTHPEVFRTALVGVSIQGRTNPVVCVERDKPDWDYFHLHNLRPRIVTSLWPKLREELLELARRHPHTAGIDTFLEHPGFPVDIRHNAKIFREKLAVWAAKRVKA